MGKAPEPQHNSRRCNLHHQVSLVDLPKRTQPEQTPAPGINIVANIIVANIIVANIIVANIITRLKHALI